MYHQNGVHKNPDGGKAHTNIRSVPKPFVHITQQILSNNGPEKPPFCLTVISSDPRSNLNARLEVHRNAYQIYVNKKHPHGIAHRIIGGNTDVFVPEPPFVSRLLANVRRAAQNYIF